MSDEPSTLLCVRAFVPGREARLPSGRGAGKARCSLRPTRTSVELWPPAPPDQLETVALARFASIDALRRLAPQRGQSQADRGSRAAGRRRSGDAARGAGRGRLYGRARGDHGHGHRNQARQGSGLSGVGRSHSKAAGDVSRIPRLVRAAAAAGETGWTTVLRFDSAAEPRCLAQVTRRAPRW